MRAPTNVQVVSRVVAQLLGLARPQWPALGVVVLLSFVAAPLALLTPVPLKLVVDTVLGGQPLPGALGALVPPALHTPTGILLVSAGLLVAVTVLTHLNELASTALQLSCGERLVFRFRARLFDQAQRLSFAHHDEKGVGDAVYRIQTDARAIQWVLIDNVVPLITSAVNLAAMLAVTALIDWQLALVGLFIAPTLLLLTRVAGRKLRHHYTQSHALESSALSVVQEALASLRVVRAFAQEEREQDRFMARSAEAVRGYTRAAILYGSFDLLGGTAIGLGTACVLVLGVLHVQEGKLTLGDLLLLLAYLGQMLKTISKKVADMSSSLACAERALELLAEPPAVVEKKDARGLSRARGAVTFDGVCFAYRPGAPQVLKDVAFEIAPGTRVGIQGPSGAGKTTLVTLMLRFQDPTAGAIRLDGVDLRELALKDLRRQFAFVPQDPMLLSGTVAENIAYARPGATREEILAAARAANAHGFIQKLPQGYDEPVGERGAKLSGGERQRIALARAFLVDAPILVLDEPTSAVDAQTESLIVDALETLMKGRTTFIIAHRLNTLRSCELLLSFDEHPLVPRKVESAPPGLRRAMV